MTANGQKPRFTKADLDRDAATTDWAEMERQQNRPVEEPFSACEEYEIIDLSEQKIDETTNLLGNRWVGCGQTGLIVGGSGIGKSSGTIQMAALWACGRAAFGIQPWKNISTLIIQAEDDRNDLIAMSSSVVNGLRFTPAEKATVRRHNKILTVQNYNGTNFISKLKAWLEKHYADCEAGISDIEPVDLIVVNPVFSYIGEGEVNDTLPVRELLRWGLQPIATEYQIGILMVHHTPKQNNRKTEKYKAHDYMYSGHGSAEFVNSARAVLIIEQTEDAGVFQFIAAKRGSHIGWPQDEKTGMYVRYYKHSKVGSLLWVEASADDVAAATDPNECRKEDVLGVLTKSPTPLIQKEIEEKLKADGLKNVRDVISGLLKELLLRNQIFIHARRHKNKKADDAYSVVPCTENVNDDVFALIPVEGIGRTELGELAKARFLYSKSETDFAIGQLKDEGKIEEKTGERNKKTLFPLK